MAQLNCGDIELISVSHTSVDNFNMEQKSSESGTIANRKGFVVDATNTNRGANGTRLNKMNAVNPVFKTTVLAFSGLAESIEEVIASKEEATIEFLMQNGERVVGSGMFVGDTEEDAQEGTIAIEVHYSGVLKLV